MNFDVGFAMNGNRTSQAEAELPGRTGPAVLMVGVAVIAVTVGVGLGLQVVSEPEPTAAPHGSTSQSDGALTSEADAGYDVLHSPPLLFLAGEPVTLEYRFVCPAPQDPEGAPACEPSGVAHILSGDGTVSKLDLTPAPDSPVDLTAEVPASVTAQGSFGYWAVLENAATSSTMVVPAAGAEAPMQATPLLDPVRVDLGTADFSTVDAPDEIVVSGAWGAGPGEFGHDEVDGPDSFDLAPDGSLVVLDQANGRLVVVGHDGKRDTRPISVTGGVPDMTIEPDGMVDVLYPDHSPEVAGPSVERFALTGGEAIDRILVAGNGAGNVEYAAGAVMAQSYPSQQWLPVFADGSALSRSDQRAGGVTGVPVGDGLQVVAKHVGDHEARIALVQGSSAVQSWVITSKTWLGPIDLVEGVDGGVLVALAEFTDDASQFRVLRLTETGVGLDLTTPIDLFVQMTVGSMFRLGPDGLYQARATAGGYSVVRYDVEG